MLAEIGKCCASNFCDSNDATFNATIKVHMSKQHERCDGKTEVAKKEKEEGWIKPIKHVSIASFYKKCNKSEENDNNSNRHDVFAKF